MTELLALSNNKIFKGLSLQRFITTISSAYRKRTTSKFIVENNGFQNTLSPKDLIIAVQEFSLNDSMKLYYTKVKYPAYLLRIR